MLERNDPGISVRLTREPTKGGEPFFTRRVFITDQTTRITRIPEIINGYR
jgi:hypothetical protein